MASISLSELDEYLFAKIFETTFPIGTIFQTTIIGNPNTIIPGATNSEWEQITDRVLIGAGNTYPAESIGGEATITLTKDQIPSHTHTRGTMNITGSVGQGYTTNGTINGGWHNHNNKGYGTGALYLSGTNNGSSCTWSNYGDSGKITLDASRSWTGETSSVGGNQPHNNIPPYYAVYIWKRTA